MTKRHAGTFRDGGNASLRRSNSTNQAIGSLESNLAGKISGLAAADASGVNGSAPSDTNAWDKPLPQDIWEAIDRIAAAWIAANPSTKL